MNETQKQQILELMVDAKEATKTENAVPPDIAAEIQSITKDIGMQIPPKQPGDKDTAGTKAASAHREPQTHSDDSKPNQENNKEEDIKCDIKLVRRKIRQDALGSHSEAFLTSFDTLPPGTVYKGGDIEFTFDDYTYKKALTDKNKGLKKMLKQLEEEKCSLPLASVLEKNPELLSPKQKLRFDSKALADDARKIKQILSDAFIEFQRERYAHLKEEGVDDLEARKMALSVFMQKMPLVAASSARLQVMLQGSDEEKAIASAVIMEAWSTAFAEYRTEIDKDIDELSTEQLQKIADGHMKESKEQFKNARKGAGDMLMDYHNDLGFVFLGAFCPPLFFLAVLPLVLPFITAAVTKNKAYAAERKISGIHRKIDERIEIATAATVSRGVVSDWIKCNTEGMAPEFMRQINSKESDGYLNKLTERHIRIRDMISALFKNNFEKQITIDSHEHTMFASECGKIGKMLEDEFKKPLVEITSDSVTSYKKILRTITESLPSEEQKAKEKKEGKRKRTVSENILEVVKSVADNKDMDGMSVFDIYKGHTLDDFGSLRDSSEENKDKVYKGEASALSTDQLAAFVKYKSAYDLNDFFKNNNHSFLTEDKVTIDAVDLDMRLRSMMSYDTAMSRRNSHKPKSGLDFLDAAFGFEHSENLKDKTFWSELEKTSEFDSIRKNLGENSLDLLKRLVIASAMAESYNTQLGSIGDNGDDFFKLPGTAPLYKYYQDAAKELEEIKGELGDVNFSLFDSACSKITDKSIADARGYDSAKQAEYDQLHERYMALVGYYGQIKKSATEIKNKHGEDNTEYMKKKNELDEIQKLKVQAGKETKKFQSENHDIYLANEITARTIQMYIEQIRNGAYKKKSEEVDREFNTIGIKDSRAAEAYFEDEKGLKEYILKNYTPLSLAGNETSLTAAQEAMALITVAREEGIDRIPISMSAPDNNIGAEAEL